MAKAADAPVILTAGGFYDGSVLVTVQAASASTVRYTTDGTEPDASSPVAPTLLRVDKGDVIKARGFTADGEPLGVLMTREFGK